MPRCLSCGRRVAGPHLPCPGLAPDPPPVPAAPGRPVPGFRLERLLGRGGFGEVWAAVREADGRRAALKVARADVAGGREQLDREAQALRAAGPPAVPALVGQGALDDGSPWLAMELLEGPSLADRMAAGAMSPSEAAALGSPLLEALAALHAAGFAHGDLKPENVFLEGEPPRARLIDLGLAARAGEVAGGGALAGTAEYMSPEQCQALPPDARSDLYAAGVILFEMATGRPPFFGAPGEVRHAHLALRPPRPGSLAAVPPELEEATLRCLAKDPAARFGSALELREALRRCLEASPGQVAQARAAAAPAAAAARSARRHVGVVFLEAAGDPLAMQGAAAALGGVLAHAQGGRYALVFDPAATDNPVRLALRAARGLLERGLAQRALVDLAAATALSRPGGADRYLSPAFSQPGSYPRPDDPPGVLATGRAAEVLVGVELLPVAGREGLRSCPPEAVAPDEPTVLRQSAAPLLGRDDVLDDLADAARAAVVDGAPALASVVGEAGLGKSHLAAALADRLRRLSPSPEVVELRARPPAEAGEGGTLRALLRWALELPPGVAPSPADAGRALLSLALPEERDAGAWTGVALALGWISPEAPELRARAAAPGALVALAVRGAGALLRGRARARPLCLLIDDAHHADGAALDAVEYAALSEAGAPIFACALARPEFAARRGAFGERAARRRAVRLEPLDGEAAAELCRRLLLPAEGVPARAVERLTARAQGVPLLLVELVRGLKRDGLVRRHAQGGSHYLATDELERTPDLPLVEWLADREMRRLPADLASHAQLTALLGDEVASEETAGVLAELERAGHGSAFPLDPGAAADRLLRLGLLSAHRGGRTGFRLSLVREAVAGSTPAALRRAIHEAAFLFYGRPGAVPEAVRLPRLARHAAGSGRAAEAGSVLLGLAEEMRARHAWLEAESLYSRALEHLPGGEARPRQRGLQGRGLMRTRVGRYRDAVADLGAAREAAHALNDARAERDCLLDEATALDWALDFAGSRARVEQAERMPGAPPPEVWCRLELGRGRSLFRASRWEEGRAALEAAAALAERLGDAAYETRVAALVLLGTSLPALGRPVDGEAALAQAQALAESRGDDLHLGAVLINRRNLMVARGDLEGAVRDQLSAVRIGREMGLLGTEYYGEYNASELFYQAARAASAEPHLRRAVEIEQRHPEVAPAPLAMLLWARLLLLGGDLGGARQRLEELRRALARARTLKWTGADLGPSESVLADMVDLATRDAGDAEWEALLGRSARDSVEQEPIEVLEMRGRAALRAGRSQLARIALEEALRLCRRIPNLLEPRVRAAMAEIGRA
ncbi:MAG TPA: protein kinase [Anaeromyxobacteraceae bacterium]|nr:protein kinase [Anaeromyxobacteraceae bacterium]